MECKKGIWNAKRNIKCKDYGMLEEIMECNK